MTAATTARMQDGRPLAEALGTPVVTSEGAILTSDTRKDSAGEQNEQARTSAMLPHLSPMEVTQLGMHRMARFMDDFIARFDSRTMRTDARRDEARRTSPLPTQVQCRLCGTTVLASETILGDFCSITCADAFAEVEEG